MAFKHGVYVAEQATSVSTPFVAESGIPFAIGAAPVQSAVQPETFGVPILCETWDDAVKKLGYSDDWATYGLCEVMYSHFQLFGASPVIFYNVVDPSNATFKEAVSADDIDVSNHIAKLPIGAIDDAALVVKAGGGSGSAFVKDTDYAVYYDGENCCVEVLPDGSAYSETALNIAYNKIKTSAVTASVIATGLEKIELCLTKCATVPDVIIAPGFSSDSTVAAAMAAKAESINGLFKAKAVIDIDADTTTTIDAAIAKKVSDDFTYPTEIVCYPMAKKGGKMFHLSTLVAGCIAAVDNDNENIPYQSPSNKAAMCDALCLADGSEFVLSFSDANRLNENGIVTALNFINGWVVWGNYTGAKPEGQDVKDYFIPVSRMFGWVGNTLIKTFWSKIDQPMNRRLIDNVVDTANIWLNGLVGQGYLLGARVELLPEENPLENLLQGIIKLHIFITPPSPAQEIDFVLEYDSSYLESALLG